MKRLIPIILILLMAPFLFGCNRISIAKEDTAVLYFDGSAFDDDRTITQPLTQQESDKLRTIIQKAKYTRDGACPFGKEVSISFGDQVFAIGYDDCETFKDLSSRKNYLVSVEEKDYIKSLFVKYVGYFPPKDR